MLPFSSCAYTHNVKPCNGTCTAMQIRYSVHTKLNQWQKIIHLRERLEWRLMRDYGAQQFFHMTCAVSRFCSFFWAKRQENLWDAVESCEKLWKVVKRWKERRLFSGNKCKKISALNIKQLLKERNFFEVKRRQTQQTVQWRAPADAFHGEFCTSKTCAGLGNQGVASVNQLGRMVDVMV